MALFMPTVLFRHIGAITPQYLHEHGIKALVLDVDNTLTAHGSQDLPAPVAQWLETMRAAGVPMTVASNNFPKRVAPFAAKIGLPFRAFCCKPSPYCFIRIRKELGLKKSELALVGDQIFTDVLGANCYGIPVLLVEPLYQDTKMTIRFKRKLERIVLSKYTQKGGKVVE